MIGLKEAGVLRITQLKNENISYRILVDGQMLFEKTQPCDSAVWLMMMMIEGLCLSS